MSVAPTGVALTGNTGGPESEYRLALNRNNQWRSRLQILNWKQTNSNSADSYQAATIAGDIITVNWVNEAESTTALYWVGTYEAPTEATDTFRWTSAGDVAQMETALLASGDDSKEFTYEDGKLKYELTAMGVTMTVEMERQ